MWRPILPLLAGLLGCGDVGPPAPEPPPPPPAAPEPAVAPWAGSAACADCHPAEEAAWAASHHGLAERDVSPAADPGLVDGALPALHDGDGPRALRAIGVDPLVQYLVDAGDGRLQVYPLAWDVARSEWFDVFADDPRQPGDWGHWTGRALNWNSMCSHCHATRVEKAWDATTDRYATDVLEYGVGCESCHGPSGPHAAMPATPPAATPTADTCAPCHSRRQMLVEDFEAGDRFLDHFAPAIPDLGDGWYPDGQVRDEDFEWASFAGSRMHSVGIGCGDCHDAHSGRLLREGDALCLGCHEALPGFAPHDRHDGQVTCADCHMPETTYMQRHPRRDHGFTHPDPALGLELGLPDACSRCHDARGDLPTAQLGGPWNAWYGDAERPRRERARAIAAARRGDSDAPHRVLAALEAEDHPFWQASLLGVLGPWSADPTVRQALATAVAADEPLVRTAAADAIAAGTSDPRDAGALLGPLLGDPVRAVRVAAARGLRAAYPPTSAQMSDLHDAVQLERDQPSGALAWGGWLVERGAAAQAVSELERAVAWDPNAPGLRHTLAVALASAGRPDDARVQLEAAVGLDPQEPELWHALGLARAGTDPAGASAALERAVTLEPTRMRSWYNLGLLRNGSGDGAGAVAALRRAAALDPGVEALWALATVSRDHGDAESARAAARTMLDRQPGHPDATALLRSLAP